MVRYTHPEMFYLFIPLLLILVWYVYKGSIIDSSLKKLGTSIIRKFLFNRIRRSQIQLRFWLTILGTIFIILASVGPQIGMKLAELTRNGVDIMVLMDTSISMNARDVTPSRMEKAKYELGRLINNLNEINVNIKSIIKPDPIRHKKYAKRFEKYKKYYDLI